MSPPRLLHLFSDPDDAPHAARIMDACGDRARHTVLGATPATGVSYEVAQDPPPLAGRPSVARYEAIARYTRRFDLVLTHGWGAIDGVMARRVFGRGAPPVVHHEDASGHEPADRVLYRRIALSAASALVVPGRAAERAALDRWRQPPARVRRIGPGVPVEFYAAKPDPKAIPELVRTARETVIGAVAEADESDDLPLLVRACGGLSGRFRLVIVGDVADRAAVLRAAEAMGVADRLHMPGPLDRPHRWLGLLDLFAFTSGSARFPLPVVEAMAAGLPVAGLPGGEVPATVSPENAPLIASHAHEVPLRDVLQRLVGDPDLRARVGAANRARAGAEHDEARMIRSYAGLYEEALNRPGALS